MDIKRLESEYVAKVKENLSVSNSRLNLFRRCHRAHYYKYCWNIVPKKKGEALQRGSAIHACLEAYYKGKSWKKEWKKFKNDWEDQHLLEEKALMGDIPQMVYDLMENYIECYETEDEDIDYLETELHFVVPLDKGIELEGYIDYIAQDNRGILIGETKTHKKFPNNDIRLFNAQSSIYAWVVNEKLNLYKEPVKRIVWNYIKAKQPTEPQLLKNGKLSVKKIDSTPYTVSKTIKKLGLKEKDYQDLIAAQSYDNYFQRHELRINRKVMESIVEDTISTANQIKNNPLLKDRNLGRDCSFCDYRSICQAELIDPEADLSFLLKADYEERGKRDGEEDNKNKKTRRNRK